MDFCSSFIEVKTSDAISLIVVSSLEIYLRKLYSSFSYQSFICLTGLVCSKLLEMRCNFPICLPSFLNIFEFQSHLGKCIPGAALYNTAKISLSNGNFSTKFPCKEGIIGGTPKPF